MVVTENLKHQIRAIRHKLAERTFSRDSKEVLEALDAIASAGVGNHQACAKRASQIRKNADQQWENGDIERIIDELDVALRSLG